jgi:hypothetical protein
MAPGVVVVAIYVGRVINGRNGGKNSGVLLPMVAWYTSMPV